MSWALATLVVVAALFLSAFFSGAEMGIYCLSRPRLHLACQRRNRQALRLAAQLDDEPGALTVTLVGTNVANYLAATAVAFVCARLLGLSDADTELYTVVLLTPVVFVFGEVVPKNLFQRHADSLMMRSSLLLAATGCLLRVTGLVALFRGIATWASRMAIRSESDSMRTLAPKRRVAALLQEALADRPLGEEQSELIERICQLSETPLHVVMVPRSRVVAISRRADRRELIHVARRSGFARLPAFDTEPRRAVGVVNVDDLLQADDWHAVGDRLEPALLLSPHTTVATAIAQMQSGGRLMSIVGDRGGQMLGIVTMADLLEQVLGDLDAPAAAERRQSR